VILPIRLYGDPILRRPAAPVRRFDADLARLVEDMLETVYAANGIGLAAPQVGVPLALFIALEAAPDDASDEAGQLAHSSADEATPEQDVERTLSREEKRSAWGVLREHVMVNPKIIERDGLQHGRDGCLSLPGLVADNVPRDLRVRVAYQDLEGHHHELSAEGYFAHVIQHESDHLRGVLFYDHLPTPERRAFLEEHRDELAAMQREARERLKAQTGSRQR